MTNTTRLLRPEHYRRMPWKNGTGVTVEIATGPDGASLDSFEWRVSMASVPSDGPFSAFPGIDRTLCVLTGAGLELTVEGDQPVQLTPDSRPHFFPADRPTHARLIGGPLEDFNVMTRRGAFRHDVAVIDDKPWALEVREHMVLLLHAFRGEAGLEGVKALSRLREGETLILDDEKACGFRAIPAPEARLYGVVLTRL